MDRVDGDQQSSEEPILETGDSHAKRWWFAGMAYADAASGMNLHTYFRFVFSEPRLRGHPSQRQHVSQCVPIRGPSPCGKCDTLKL